MTACSEQPAGESKRPAAVVVAHPDDEALWLSSAILPAERVVYCFGDLYERPRDAQARRRALEALPLSGIVTLAVPESGAGFCADWTDPRPTPFGIEITETAARARYESNYDRVLAGLRGCLAGFAEVYTHNPWGEYGHAEHIQVHRAVAALQAELGYTLWFSNYVGKRSWPLARRLGGELRWTERRSVRPDRATARTLRGIYRRHGAWTWSSLHYWPAREALYALAPGGAADVGHRFTGEELLDVARLRGWPPWPFPRRRLRA
ncbi:MAG: PIG-L family deacetylase [Steroidobacteraceae bacterium]